MLIFPSNFLNPREVDEAYAAEAEAARAFGLEVGFLDQAAFDEGAYERSIRSLSREDEATAIAVYRGWMLTLPQYIALYESLLKRGIRLVNSPDQYQHCHEFPGTWEQIRDMAPPAVWVPVDEAERGEPSQSLLSRVQSALEPFAGSAAILKDYVKSEKEYWDEACFVADTSSADDVQRVVRRFMELRGDRLTGGLVFKKYVDLQAAPGALKEYRLFYYNHMLMLSYPRGVADKMFQVIPIEQINGIADTIKSDFFTIDVAGDVHGNWWIVEVGDGQVSGLPEPTDPYEFIKGIMAIGQWG